MELGGASFEKTGDSKFDGYRRTAGSNDDERTRLLLETALFKRKIINIQIALIHTTNDEKRRALEQDQRALEQDRRTNEQLQLRFLPPQQMAQPGN
jgi:hypothetical protein